MFAIKFKEEKDEGIKYHSKERKIKQDLYYG